MHQGEEAVCLLIFTSCRAASDYCGAPFKHAQDQHWVSHADLQLGLQISAKSSHMH